VNDQFPGATDSLSVTNADLFPLSDPDIELGLFGRQGRVHDAARRRGFVAVDPRRCRAESLTR